MRVTVSGRSLRSSYRGFLTFLWAGGRWIGASVRLILGGMDSPSALRPGHAALRHGRASLAGQIYLVTFTTRHRKPFFSEATLAGTASKALTDPIAWQRSRLLAWVLMPDHWHGLIELGNEEELSSIVRRIKSNSARCLRMEIPDMHAVWARAFHDRALRTGQDVLQAARYVVLNPVRAGLAPRLHGYPYWDAAWL